MWRTISLQLALLLAFVSAPAFAQDLYLRTENDIFSTQPARDDLHTFAVAFEVERDETLFALREDAFTDRAGGIRFDETQLSIGRALPDLAGWSARGEIGAVRVGRGIFGEDAQNRIHRTLGSEEVELPYADPSLHARLAFAGERSIPLGPALFAGPRVELEWVSSLRAHAVVAAQATYEPNRYVELHFLAGVRASDASVAPLERHTEPFGAVVRLGVTALERIVFAWSYNDHGDGRTHLTVGYRFSSWRSGEAPPVRN